MGTWSSKFCFVLLCHVIIYRLLTKSTFPMSFKWKLGTVSSEGSEIGLLYWEK